MKDFQQCLSRKEAIIYYHEYLRPRPSREALAKHFNTDVVEVNSILNDQAYERVVDYFQKNKCRANPSFSKTYLRKAACTLGMKKTQVNDFLQRYLKIQKVKEDKKRYAEIVEYYEGFAVKPTKQAIATHFGLPAGLVRRVINRHEFNKATASENVPVATRNEKPKVWHHDKVSKDDRKGQILIDLTNDVKHTSLNKHQRF